MADKLDNGSISRNSDVSSTSDSEGSSQVVYQGPVYHIGVNRVGHHFCHARYLRIQGSLVEMFKKEPNLGQKPIRRGRIGKFLKVEELGRRKIDDKELYVVKIFNALDDTRKGEIACNTAAEALRWLDAFQQAKEAASDFKSSGHKFLNDKDEFELSGHRHRLRNYARGLTRLITIGRGSDYLFGKGTSNSHDSSSEIYAQKREDDAVEEHDWRCVRTVNGIRILEDVSVGTVEKTIIMKSISVIDASPSSIFEILMDLKNPHRKEWDILTGDLKFIDRIDGHCDIVHGTFDPKYLSRWNSKRDFVLSRMWRHDPDNTYTIFMSSTKHKNCPKKSGFRRITLNPSIWEIKPVPFNRPGSSRSLVSQTMEIQNTGWGRWTRKYYAKLDKTVPYVILCQLAGLRDFIASSPALDAHILTTEVKKGTMLPGSREEDERPGAGHEEFYDAIAAEVPDEEDEYSSEEDDEKPTKKRSHRFRSIALGVMRLTPHARAEAKELSSDSNPVKIDFSKFTSSQLLPPGCWTDPGGREFMVRGKTYLTDYMKVSGGDPLLKLLTVNWFRSENKINFIAANPDNIVQSEAGKQLPFILVINLQVPAAPNYSLVFYFGAERPISKGSLLDHFVNGSDSYRDSRFKLIPRIVEGYWFVKRAVGTKACLLGKAVACNYLRQDNFLEIDVDIGSSSVARSIIQLVLGQVTSIVVDMAVLIEGKDEKELPEYLLGTVRINRIQLEAAAPYA